MRHPLLPVTAVVWSLCAGAAIAAPAASVASQSFKDVPAGHWAESAVTSIAVERSFMRGYPDGTFRGNEPFTRLQMAFAVHELIKELEAKTGKSWATAGLGGYEFLDAPAEPEARQVVLKLANEYRLFEGVPGVTSRTFEGGKQVTRYEMAKVVHRLMRLGEERGAVDPAVLPPQIFTFADLPPRAWAYNEVRDVADRYQVMIGFPDGTFRGPEELTRYQFAASAAQTFPLVRQLVDRTRERQEQGQPAAVAPSLRFQEATPWMLGLLGTQIGGTTQLGLNGRAVNYYGDAFLLAEARAGFPLDGSATHLYSGALQGGWALQVGGVSLQPYLGATVLGGPQFTMGGVSYGMLAYGRPAPAFGLYGRLNGLSPVAASTTNSLGPYLGRGTVGLEYYFTPGFGLVLEGGYGQEPAVIQLPVAPGSTGPTSSLQPLGSPQGTLGLLFKF